MHALRVRGVRASFSLVIALSAIAALPIRARACVSCGCGDPTLTAVGVEKPYKNRLRVAVDARLGVRTTGAEEMHARVLGTRTQLGVAYTPHPRVTLVGFLPLIASELSGPARSTRVVGIGDLELQARVVVARDRSWSPRHLLWLLGGVKAPTAPRLVDDRGYPYADDEQPGSGSWDPIAGATYAWFGDPITIYSSLVFRHPTDGPRGYRFGPSLVSSTFAQLQPWRWLALQLGAELRYAWADRLSNDAAAPDSGGFVAALVPGFLVNPYRDLLVRAAVEVPVVQQLHGTQSVGPQLIVTLSYDIL